MSTTYHEVDLTTPCGICGKGDWCQWWNGDGGVVFRMCRRQDGAGARAKIDGSGVPYYLYVEGGSTKSANGTAGPAERQDVPEPVAVRHRAERAAPDVLDPIYTAMLAQLTVAIHHEQDLMTRGFARSEIERLGYRTKPTTLDEWAAVKRTLLNTWDAKTLVSVPGISAHKRVNAEGKDYIVLRLDGPPSILLPLRDRYGRTHGVQLDVDGERPSKYLPLTSYGDVGARARLVVHVPLHDPCAVMTYAVRLVGGVYKADIATLRTGVLTLCAPSEYGYAGCLEDITAIDPAIVCIAPDADVRSNPQVASALAAALVLYQSSGNIVALETWPPQCGKGIDDVIANGHADRIDVLTGVPLWEFAREVLRSSKAPPSPGVEARLVLAQLGEPPDEAALFRPSVIEAVASLDTATSEYHALKKRLVDGLTNKGQAKAWESALSKEREKRADEGKIKRIEALEAQGKRVFRLGDHKELRDAVLDDLCPVGGRSFDHSLIVFTRGRFFTYARAIGIWVELPASRIINAAAKYSGSPVGQLDGRSLTITGATARGVLDLVRADREDLTFFDEPRPGMAFTNGFLSIGNIDTSTGVAKLEPHARTNRARYAYEFEYVPHVEPTRYLGLLARTCRDMPEGERRDTIACLTQHLGASLLGVATRFEKVIILDGKGGTGNSTLLEVHSGVMPPGSVSAVLPHMMDDAFAVANLDGALLNIADDLPKRELMDAGRVKSIISGKQIEAGPKNVQNYKFRPLAGQLWACNGLPRTHDTTGGFRRRPVILKFTSPIAEAEVNRSLAADILREERPAIIALAIAALAVALKQNALTVPAASEARVDEWLGDSQPLARFVREEMVVLDGAARDETKSWTAAKSVYRRYQEWCEETGHKSQSDTTFGKDLKEMLGIKPEQWSKAPYKRNDASYYPVLFADEKERTEREARKQADQADHNRLAEEFSRSEFNPCPN